jgi:DNA-binding GntR family transcriptional regulator
MTGQREFLTNEPPLRSDAGGRGFGVQTVYDQLRRDIIDLRLAPGEPLDETRLSQRFGMSRTPVREALVRLAADGLVTTVPNRTAQIVGQLQAFLAEGGVARDLDLGDDP